MNTIKLLDQKTIDKIAAGEVVDRPASIVKELVENSIDAGASSISVEIRDGGISMIRITDNGSGIPREQIALAFLRHSTSKISDASDLSFIHTLGFRGEALSSIAAVSRLELCTKTRDSLTGTIYRIEGGTELSNTEAGLPDGTTVIVKDLFFNTPARLKFLKSAQTESGSIQDMVQRIALSHPEIAFKYTSNGSVKLSTSGNGSMKDAIYHIFGRDITANLLEVEEQTDLLSVSGFIGKPEIARGNRNFEFFFINGRYVKDRIIQKALEDAYLGYQMKGTFPFAVFHVRMEPELVDVNVHPSKMEVRFFNSEAVYHFVYDILRGRISRGEHIPQITLGTMQKTEPAAAEKKSYVPEPFEQGPSAVDYRIEQQNRFLNEDIPYHTVVSPDLPPSESVQRIGNFISETARPRHRIIGELFETYWIVEYDNQMFIIDQHAAHEKVLYERFVRHLQSGVHDSQQLMPAIVVTLSIQEETALEQYLEIFRDAGFEIEHFGGSEYTLSAVPADLYTVDPKLVFLEMLDELADVSGRNHSESLSDRIATAACKAAVKGGNRLSFREADALLDELLQLDNPYHCPHGRPTIISMSKYEIEKKFKRIV